MQPDEPEVPPLHTLGDGRNGDPIPLETPAPTPVSMDAVQLDMSQLTVDDVERAFPAMTQEQEQALRMQVGQIVFETQRNWDIGRQVAVLIAGAQSLARLIGFALKP